MPWFRIRTQAQTATSAQSGSLWADGRQNVGRYGRQCSHGGRLNHSHDIRTHPPVMAGTQTTRDSQVSAGVGSIRFGTKLFLLWSRAWW